MSAGSSPQDRIHFSKRNLRFSHLSINTTAPRGFLVPASLPGDISSSPLSYSPLTPRQRRAEPMPLAAPRRGMFPSGQGRGDALLITWRCFRVGGGRVRPSIRPDHAEEGTRGSPRVTSRLGLSSGELQPGMRKIHLTWGVSTDTSLQPRSGAADCG